MTYQKDQKASPVRGKSRELAYVPAAFPGARDPDGPAPDLARKLAAMGLAAIEPDQADLARRLALAGIAEMRETLTNSPPPNATAADVQRLFAAHETALVAALAQLLAPGPPARLPRPPAGPLFYDRQLQLKPVTRTGIEEELRTLPARNHPSKDMWDRLTGAQVDQALLKAARMSAAVAMIRGMRANRPDLDPDLRAALEAHGRLSPAGTKVEMRPGFSMGLGLVKPEVIKLLFAFRYLSSRGEL